MSILHSLLALQLNRLFLAFKTRARLMNTEWAFTVYYIPTFYYNVAGHMLMHSWLSHHNHDKFWIRVILVLLIYYSNFINILN